MKMVRDAVLTLSSVSVCAVSDDVERLVAHAAVGHASNTRIARVRAVALVCVSVSVARRPEGTVTA